MIVQTPVPAEFRHTKPIKREQEGRNCASQAASPTGPFFFRVNIFVLSTHLQVIELFTIFITLSHLQCIVGNSISLFTINYSELLTMKDEHQCGTTEGQSEAYKTE